MILKSKEQCLAHRDFLVFATEMKSQNALEAMEQWPAQYKCAMDGCDCVPLWLIAASVKEGPGSC